MLLNVIGVVGSVLALVGLPGMYTRAAREGGLVWLLGVFLIALTGMLFGIFLGLASVVVFPVLANRVPDLFREGPPPAFFAVFIVGTVANAVGAVLMGIPMLTKGIYPRWCGYMMLLEAVLAVAGFFLSGPSSTSLASQILNVASPLPLFLVVGWAGYELWSGRAPSSEVVARTVASQPA